MSADLRDRRLFLGTASMTDRLIGAGHLPRELVEDYAAVGPLARGSGVSTDARHERPYGDYRRLGLAGRHPIARATPWLASTSGSASSFESLRILRRRSITCDAATVSSQAPLPPQATGAAFGWAEAPQGELVVWVGAARRIGASRRIASPSLRNWALFDHAFPKDVLTDFAFIEHSFGLTPAGADR